jgi:hypothetical protein
MNIIEKVSESQMKRTFAEIVMKLHTGETIVQATEGWKWEDREKLGNRLLQNLAEDILQYRVQHAGGYGDQEEAELTSQLISSLELDGYLFRNNRLLFSEAAVLDTEEEGSVLIHLMQQLKLPDIQTPTHHLSLSVKHYQDRLWDDCIGNARKVLESVLSQVASVHSAAIQNSPLPQTKLDRPVDVRDYLERMNLLESKEKKALAEVYGLLSNTGGHPYIAEKDQARLMRHLALTFTQFALLRLQGALTAAGITR